LLVNTIGSFHGVEAMDFDGTNPPDRLQIQGGSGSWTLTIEDPSVAAAFGTSKTGSGDAVLAYNGSANTAALAFIGQGNFVVEQYDSAGQSGNLLANEIGNYKGTVPIDSGGFIVIQADGAWAVSLSSS
jgi:hypothetical protein